MKQEKENSDLIEKVMSLESTAKEKENLLVICKEFEVEKGKAITLFGKNQCDEG